MIKKFLQLKNIHLAMILILAASIRIVYWLEVKNEAWFIAPGTDADYYLNWAKDILTGNASEYFPFPRAPLYPYIVAGIQKVFGFGWVWVRLFNLVCDLLTVTLVYKLTVRIKDRRAGLIAGIIFSVSGASIYFTGEVLMTSLATLCMTWTVFNLISFNDNNVKLKFIYSGIGIGVMALLRPNILLLLPFTSAYAYYVNRKRGKSAWKITVPAIHIVSALTFLIPTILINYQAAGHIIPVSSQGGVNFLIGNVRGADGWSSTLPAAGPSWSTEDARILASNYMRRELTDAQVSPVLWRMGLNEIVAAPIDWISLMVKKSLMFVNYREIANNRPFLLPKEQSFLFSFLSLISLGAIFPLALIGIFRFRRSHEIKIIGFSALFYALSIIIFFVTTRYRTPIFPVFAVLAGLGITEIINSRKSEKQFFKLLSIFLIGGLISYPGWAGSDFSDDVQARFIAGNAYLRMDQPEEALKLFNIALDLKPDFYELNLNAGVAWLSVGDTDKAEHYFSNEIDHWRENPKAYNNLGVIREGQGSLSEAIKYYKRSLAVDASFADARENLARIYLHRGDAIAQQGALDSAIIYYNQVLILTGESAGLLHRLAMIALNDNDITKAIELLENGLALDPGFAPTINLLREIQFQE